MIRNNKMKTLLSIAGVFVIIAAIGYVNHTAQGQPSSSSQTNAITQVQVEATPLIHSLDIAHRQYK
jgi:hypothetical protein